MRSQPFVEELTPAPDPWQIAQTFSSQPHLIFFDSSERHPEKGRYSFIAADPIAWQVVDRVEFGASDPFAKLAGLVAAFPTETLAGLPPFQGGLAGLFAYGLGHAIERLPGPQFDEFQVPALAVGLYDWVIGVDHLQERAWLFARDSSRLKAVRRHLEQTSTAEPRGLGEQSILFDELAPQYPLEGHPQVTSTFDRSTYLQTVYRAMEYIHAGDCFQVNIAQRLLSPLREPPLHVYARLRKRNPAPFSGYFDLGSFAIASASPERFLKVNDRSIETWPIKGTRPRGKTPEEDNAHSVQLATSDKDRAENVMIVDLLRNDLGRVCEYGSISVPRVCQLETYRYVHHLVSGVAGKLRKDRTAFDLLRAAFPGGSVTGAPKVRAMEIISELEPTARGPYCGSLGYIGFDGAMDSNILIRTFTLGKGWMQFPVGGGVVADSDPAREYAETLHKAAGLLEALRNE